MSRKLSTFVLTTLVAGLLFVAPAARADLVPQSEQVERTDALPRRLVGVEVTQRLSAPAPVNLGFADEDGHPVMLRDYFDGRLPVILTLNYSNCPMLCSLQLHALVEGLKKVSLTIGKDYRISANDLIEIDLPDIDALKRTLRVNAAGLVSLPLVGSVQIAGLTSEGAERRIAERYQEKYLQNPQVAVFIKEFTAERITMEGAVVKPGIYPVTGQLTLLRALALAGGFGPIANSSEVMLFRVDETTKKREMLTFDVEKIRTGKSEDPPVKGDDLIVVQRDSTRRLLKDSIIRDVFDTFNPFSILAR